MTLSSTRIAVLADIHGSLPALEAVIADLTQYAVQQVVVAGDSINWGPFSAQVMERLVSLGWSLMRGNHEFYLLDWNTPRAPAHWANYGLPVLLREQIQGRLFNLIASLPDTLSLRFPDAPPLRVVHGSPDNHWQPLYPTDSDAKIADLLAGITETTVVTAHTHLAMERRVGQWHVLNPGSVGVPLDGIRGARYLLLEGSASGWTPTFRRVAFDDSALYQEMERLGYTERFGALGRMVIEEFKTARPYVYPFNEWHRAHHTDARPTLALAEAFLRLDDLTPYLPLPYQWDSIMNGKHSPTGRA